MFKYRTVYPFRLYCQMRHEFKTEEKHQITESDLALKSMGTHVLCISISNLMNNFHLNKNLR